MIQAHVRLVCGYIPLSEAGYSQTIMQKHFHIIFSNFRIETFVKAWKKAVKLLFASGGTKYGSLACITYSFVNIKILCKLFFYTVTCINTLKRCG